MIRFNAAGTTVFDASILVTNIKLWFFIFVELFVIKVTKTGTCFRVTLFGANFVTLFTHEFFV